MSDKLKGNLTKYGITFAVMLGMAYLHISLTEDFSHMQWVDKCRLLCDAFTIPGVIALMAGILMWLSNQGTMDGLSYVLRTGLRLLIPGKGLDKTEKYADFVERKRGKRVKGYGFLFVSGGVFLAVSLVFLVLFYIAF